MDQSTKAKYTFETFLRRNADRILMKLFQSFNRKLKAFPMTVAIVSLVSIVGAQPSDLNIYRPEVGVWVEQGQGENGGFRVTKIGSKNDIPFVADIDGDGVNERIVWNRTTGIWTILNVESGEYSTIQWGQPTTDIPFVADLDGDKAAEVGFWRNKTGCWHVLNSADHFAKNTAIESCWGEAGDIPVPADYDGDGKTDLATYRPSESTWYIMESGSQRLKTNVLGRKGDILVPSDYSGDGRADVAVFRNGKWIIVDSKDGSVEEFTFGFADSIPVPSDYDGDGLTDMAVWKEGRWYMLDSREGTFRSIPFGTKGDVPIPSTAFRKVGS